MAGKQESISPSGDWVYRRLKHYEHPTDLSKPLPIAPKDSPAGGALFFDNTIERADFDALMRITGVISHTGRPDYDYAILQKASENPKQDGYLTQVRFIGKHALRFYPFSLLTEEEYRDFPDQVLSMEDSMWEFIQGERREWGTSFGSSPKLQGIFGGDGWNSCEQLSFGFMPENDLRHVYRLWSRAWLVHK